MKSQWFVCQCGTMFRSPYRSALCPECAHYKTGVSYRTWGSLIALIAILGSMLYVFGVPW